MKLANRLASVLHMPVEMQAIPQVAVCVTFPSFSFESISILKVGQITAVPPEDKRIRQLYDDTGALSLCVCLFFEYTNW